MLINRIINKCQTNYKVAALSLILILQMTLPSFAGLSCSKPALDKKTKKRFGPAKIAPISRESSTTSLTSLEDQLFETELGIVYTDSILEKAQKHGRDSMRLYDASVAALVKKEYREVYRNPATGLRYYARRLSK